MDLSICSGSESDSEDEKTKDSDYESSDHSESEAEDEENKSEPTSEESTGAGEKLQKINKLTRFMPYSGQLVTIRIQLWRNLKANLCTAMVEQGQPLSEWIYACNQYLTAFGLALTKADHIMLIKLCWQTLINTEHDFFLLKKLANLIVRLLKLPSLIHRSELSLDWRQLYQLIDRINHNPHVRKQTIYFEAGLYQALTTLVSTSKFYFTAESTAEMLAEWREYICIYSNKYNRYLYLLMLFLPTQLPPEEHQFGFKLWFDDFMQLWTALPAQDTAHQFSYFLFIFSNLAKNAFGYVDWEPYTPMILQRVKKRLNCKSATDLELSMCASWFVYMISPTNSFLDALKQYFKFRFSNHKRIICYLLSKFIVRLKVERRKVKFWYDFTPTSHLLTSEIEAAFSAWMVEQFEKIAFADFEIEHLYHLSLICKSSEVSEQVWEKLAIAEDRIFEPDRLKFALQLFSVSLFPMVSDEKLGPTHRTHVIPVLSRLLRSINTNDHTLCYLHLFAIRSIIVMGIPLEDCSHWLKTKEGLDKDAVKILTDSAQLEDFPMQFLEILFEILDSNNDDLFRMNQKGMAHVRNIIFEVLCHIFVIISEEKFRVLADRLIQYATTRIIESVEVCKILDKMILACLLSDKSERSFELFFTAVSANIRSSIDSETKYSNICKTEFVYNWRLLHTCFSFDGHLLLKYQKEIVDLLKRIYEIDFEDNFKHNNLITDVLSFLFYILTSIYLPCYALDFKSTGPCGEKNRDQLLFERLVKFPYTCKLRELPLKWHEPCEGEIQFAKQLFNEFIKPEMASLDAWASSKIELANSQVEKSFGIILSFLGIVHCIPNFKADETGAQMKYFTLPDIFSIDLFDGENFRDNLISLMVKVNAKLKLKDGSSDNVTLTKLLLEVMDYTLFNYKTITTPKSISHSIYRTLIKEKSTLPIVQYYYIISYQLGLSCLLKRWCNLQFSSTHNVAMELLLELSTCSSSKIRSQAQGILIDIWETFPRSFEPFLPRLLENLKKAETDYGAFKGSLFLMYGNSRQSITLNTDWRCLLQVWPALIAVNNAEKPKIANLFDVWFYPLFTDHYQTIPIELDLLSGRFANIFRLAGDAGWKVPSAEEIGQIEKKIQDENDFNRDCYRQLIEKLLKILDEKLHWRFWILGCTLLDLLIRHDQPYPVEAIEFFLENLVNELISIRGIAIVAFKKVLFLYKPKKVITIDADLQSVDPNDLALDCIDDQSRYESIVFHDKVHDGYSDGVPKICCRFVEQDCTKLDFVREKFRDEEFLDKLFCLHSVEQENKATCTNTVKLWKHLTQVFKLFNDELIFPRIESLLTKKKHNYDKFALEVLCGVVKASHHLSHEQMSRLKLFLKSLFDALPVSFNKEAYSYWYSLFQACFQFDFRRYSWVFEHFFGNSELFTDTWGPYHTASFMYFVATAQPSNWRYSKLSQQVLDRLFEHLSHKYNYVRYSVSYMLSNAFHYRIGLGLGEANNTALEPKCADFIDRVQAKLISSLSSLSVPMDDEAAKNMATIKSDLFDSDSPAGQELQHLCATISHWVSDCMRSKNLVNGFDFVKFLPQLALIQTTNESLQRHAKNAISYIAVHVYRPEDIDAILDYVKIVARNWNWHTRAVASTFSHTLVFNNRFILRQRKEWVDAMVGIILALLADDVIEVRESARQTFRDFIKWQFFDDAQRDELIEQFKAKSMEKGTEPGELIQRHCGILGLCAFIYAYQAEMPDFLPDIVLFLARRVSDPQPIQKTATAALRFFKKTHEPYWTEHKRKFSEEQLAELGNVLISSSCFA